MTALKVIITCPKCDQETIKKLTQYDIDTDYDCFYGSSDMTYDFHCEKCGTYHDIKIE